MIARPIGSAAGFLALALVCGIASGLILAVLPPLGASPEFAKYTLFMALNFVFGVILGGRIAERYEATLGGVLWALVCSAALAFAMALGSGTNPGAAALCLGPVMTGMAYWSAVMSRTIPQPEEDQTS